MAVCRQRRRLSEASWFAASDFDRERFRRFRHALPEAVNDLVRRRGVLKMNTDFAVPFERNREMIAIYREDARARISRPVRNLRSHR